MSIINNILDHMLLSILNVSKRGSYTLFFLFCLPYSNTDEGVIPKHPVMFGKLPMKITTLHVFVSLNRMRDSIGNTADCVRACLARMHFG